MKVIHIPFSNRNPYQKLLADGLEAHGVSVKGEKIRHLGDISFLNLSLLTLLLHHWKPDIVHLHWQSSFLHVAGSRFKTILKSSLFIFQLRILKFLGIKLVWTIHNLKKHETTYRDLESSFTDKLAGQADRIIVHCQSAKDEFLRQFGNQFETKTVVIAHGNFSNYYRNTVDREKARKNLDLPESQLTFLFLGELRYYKGVIELIETFRSINDNSLQLLIAGRPHNEIIAAEIQARTKGKENIFVNKQFVADDNIQDFINAADIMVFPYRNIFTSGSIFLALSFGIPIIAPKLGCINDTLYGTDNFIYDVNEKNGLMDAMRKTINSKNNLVNISRSNLELAGNFKWNKIAMKTCIVYKDCLIS